MKKVAIILDEMSIGGIPKACVDFANQLKNYYDVVLLMRNSEGSMMGGLSNDISVKIIQTPQFRKTIRKLFQEHKYLKLFNYIFQYLLWTKVSNRWVKANELTAKTYGVYEEDDYDCAIAYHGMSISQILVTLYGVNSRKKVAWIHGDHPFENIHKQDITSVYEKFDKIFCVSLSVCTRFLNDFPTLENIVDSYKNLLLPKRIIELSEEIIEDDINKECINLVTVGRISEEKGQDLIPPVAVKLKHNRINIQWYIVGDGPDTDRIKKLTYELGVDDTIHFLGSKSNPYPYMKMCDIYVQPSYTEGYCLTVCEAAILGKPIVLTKIAAAEILENNKTAIVVQPTVDSLAEGIEKMIFQPNIQCRIKKNLAELDLSNNKEINKLLDFI